MISILLAVAAFSAHISLSDVKDPLIVTLEVTHPENTYVEREGLGKRLTTNLFNTKPPFKLIKEDLNHLTFTLSPMLEGRHPITFYEISFVSQEGKKTTIASPMVFVDIPSKTPKNYGREVRGIILMALPILYLGLSTVMLVSFYTPPPLTEEQKKEKERQIALKELSDLTKETPSKSLVQTLSKITKHSLTLPTAETTEEILETHKDPKLMHILQTADLVTFSGADLSQEEKGELIQDVKLIIK